MSSSVDSRNKCHWDSCSAVEQDPDRVHGAWVFTGTRVPLEALFANLSGGATIDEFVDWFPGVTLPQICEVLEHEFKLIRATQKLADPV